MNQNQQTNPQSPDETVPSAPVVIEVTDLEPEQEVSGGYRSQCQNNLKQMGIA